MVWSAKDYYLMKISIITGEPAIEHLAKLFNVCELELYDKMQALKIVMVSELNNPESMASTLEQKVYAADRAIRDRPKKKYYLKTRDLDPIRIQAPPGKKNLPKASLPDDIDPPIKIRPKAVYSNHSPMGIATELVMTG